MIQQDVEVANPMKGEKTLIYTLNPSLIKKMIIRS